MHKAIQVSVDSERGCGWREKAGAVYLVADGLGRPCGKFPIPLARVCDCCGQLVYDVAVVDGKPILRSRSHRKLENPAPLINGAECKLVGVWVDGVNLCTGWDVENHPADNNLVRCPMVHYQEDTPALLEWVGEKHYPTPDSFTVEATAQGVCRRIRAVPDWFEVGKTWVFLAHGQGIPIKENILWNRENPEEPQRVEFLPALFHAYKPSRAEVIVDETTADEKIDQYLEQGLTPTIVRRQNDAGEIICVECNENIATHAHQYAEESGGPVCDDCYIPF